MMYFFNVLKSKYDPKHSKEVKEARKKELAELREAGGPDQMTQNNRQRIKQEKRNAGERTIGDEAGVDIRKRPILIDEKDAADYLTPEIHNSLRLQTVPITIRDDSGGTPLPDYLLDILTDDLVKSKLQEYPFHPYGTTKVDVFYESVGIIPDAIEDRVIDIIKQGGDFDTVWFTKDGEALSGAAQAKVQSRTESSSPHSPSKFDTDPSSGKPIFEEDNLSAFRSAGETEFDRDEEQWFQQLERHPKENEADKYDWSLHSIIQEDEDVNKTSYLNGIWLFHGSDLSIGAGMEIQAPKSWTAEGEEDPTEIDQSINVAEAIDLFNTQNLNWRRWK